MLVSVVILAFKHNHSFLKMLQPLKQTNLKIDAVYCIHPSNCHFSEISADVISIPLVDDDYGATLNHLLPKMNASHTLIVNSQASLSKDIAIHQLTQQDTIVTGNHFACLITNHAILHFPFPDKWLLPFPESLLPFYLCTLPSEKKNLVTQSSNWATASNRNKSTTYRSIADWQQLYELEQAQSQTIPVTVLIANYNQGNYLDTAIASCLTGSIVPEAIFVSDDGSTDSSPYRLTNWNHPTVTTSFTDHNQGKVHALNDLLPSVQTPFILELDADDWLDPNAFSVLAETLKMWPTSSPLLYGNLRRWKEERLHQLTYKGIAKGRAVSSSSSLRQYRFPLGPRIYRTASLRCLGGFIQSPYEEGRLYEDVSTIYQLAKIGPLHYEDFTIYNVRDHAQSITQKNHSKWNGFLKQLDH